MSQFKLPVIVPTVDTGTTLSNSLNKWSAAVDSSQSGTTPPASPTVGNVWYDTTAGNEKLKIWDGTRWCLVISEYDIYGTQWQVQVGHQAGHTTQGPYGTAIGWVAGQDTQGDSATAVGRSAGEHRQGDDATAIGREAGKDDQGAKSFAGGYSAGQISQGTESIAIGYLAGYRNQGDNGIIISARGSAIDDVNPNHIHIRTPTGGLVFDGSVMNFIAPGGLTLNGSALGTGGTSTPVDYTKLVSVSTTPPASPVNNQTYYDPAAEVIKEWSGGAWKTVANFKTGLVLKADGDAAVGTARVGETIWVTGGTGISTKAGALSNHFEVDLDTASDMVWGGKFQFDDEVKFEESVFFDSDKGLYGKLGLSYAHMMRLPTSGNLIIGDRAKINTVELSGKNRPQWVDNGGVHEDLAILSDIITVAATAPTSPATGRLWFDTATGVNKLKVYDGTNWDELAMVTAAARPLTYIGVKDVTAAIGTYTPSNGDYLIVGKDGEGQATWTGLSGLDVKKGDSAVYDGAKWDLMIGAAHTPKPADEVYSFTAYDSAGGLDVTITVGDGTTFDIDWGDGTVAAVQASALKVTHAYADSGNYLVKITSSGISKIETARGGSFKSITRLPADLLEFKSGGLITTVGDLANLPDGLQKFRIGGGSVLSGKIDNLPTGLAYFQDIGSTTISGDIGSLPVGIGYLEIAGRNTTTGDIGTLPKVLKYYQNRGNNTTSGDISTLPSGMATYRNEGSNTTSGDLAALPSGLTSYFNAGSNTCSLLGATIPMTSLDAFVQAGTNALPSAQVDKILKALDADVSTWTRTKKVTLDGANAAPTAASSAAIASLQAKGVTVTTN